jgi:2-haloacid dehalogenase/putative hydrolase of the HAD superfamily
LIDWREGIGSAFERAAARAGRTVSTDRVLLAHAEIEPQVQAGEWMPYRDVLRRTAVRIAQALEWELDLDDAGFLPESLPRWQPFPDVVPALRRLVDSGCRLGILSNVDDDLIAETISELGVDFHLVVTAERVRSYKPGRAHFDAARREIGDRSWLHAAQSLFHDVAPARQLGIPVAWINRLAERAPGAVRPDFELATVADLADRIGS